MATTEQCLPCAEATAADASAVFLHAVLGGQASQYAGRHARPELKREDYAAEWPSQEETLANIMVFGVYQTYRCLSNRERLPLKSGFV